MAFTKLKEHFFKFNQRLETIKEGEELSTEQEYFETDEPFDDEYELIKSEHLSQISFVPNEYNQTTIKAFKNKALPSLMDSRSSLRKQVCTWFTEDHGLTKSEEELNRELLNILKYLDWHDESAFFDCDNGSVGRLEEFLKNNKSNPDLKVVLELKRGESYGTVLHAVSGAHIYEEVGRNQEDQAVRLLLAAGADPNAKNSEGETPLHCAAASGNSKGVISLLRKTNICCNKQEKTPRQVAIDGGHYDVAELFLTDEQKKLQKELYDTFAIPGMVSDLTYFTKKLKEFLNKHKSNPDLRVVLNLQSERGGLVVLEFAEGVSYSNKAIGAEIRNLFLKAGASYDVSRSTAKTEHDFGLFHNLTLNQQRELDKYFNMVSKAEDMDKLEKVIDEAIRFGVQLNFNKDFSPGDPIASNWYSLADWTLKRIGELSKLKRNPEVASNIVCNLVSRGAIFCNRNSIDVIDKLELEFKRHKDNIFVAYVEYIDNAHKLIRVARSATNGRLNNARMDNAVFYLEYSDNSTINVAMVTGVVRDLELNQEEAGYNRNIIKIGKSEVEIITENGIRNYANLADNSDIVLTFCTSQGKLEVRLFPDTKNKDLIMVKVNNQDLFKQLENCKEELGKNCLLGGYSVYNAIEQGYFERSSSTPKTWVEKIQESNQRQGILNSL